MEGEVGMDNGPRVIQSARNSSEHICLLTD
jgi:hypothetical protein